MFFKPIQYFLLAGSFFFIVSCATISIGFSKKNLNKIVERSHTLIEAIEKYKNETGEYPPDLKILIPNYIEELPKTGIKPFEFGLPLPVPMSGKEPEYWYLRYKEQDALKNPVENGYRLLVIADPFTFIDDENLWKCLLYRSSKKYPDLRLEKLQYMIGDWAVVVRASGSLYKTETDNYDIITNY